MIALKYFLCKITRGWLFPNALSPESDEWRGEE